MHPLSLLVFQYLFLSSFVFFDERFRRYDFLIHYKINFLLLFCREIRRPTFGCFLCLLLCAYFFFPPNTISEIQKTMLRYTNPLVLYFQEDPTSTLSLVPQTPVSGLLPVLSPSQERACPKLRGLSGEFS